MEQPQWTLQEETKEILDYPCQKATANFRGRTWTAWYAIDIPIQEGPWKLWGLPGLILEAQDADKLFTFKAVGIKQQEEDIPIQLAEHKYVVCKRSEYLALMQERYEDPNKYMKRISPGVVGSLMDATGKAVTGIAYENIERDDK